MRYGKDQKQATRQRILEAAGRRFKQDGIDGAGVAALMSDAGLTNGAFYPHFHSKAELVRECLGKALHDQLQKLQDALRTGGLDAVVETYLSRAHRDNAGKGCVFAALLPELARQPEETRRRFAKLLQSNVGQLSSALSAQAHDSEAIALGLYATLIGTLQLARATRDTALSDRILAAGASAARTLGRQGRGKRQSRRRAARTRSTRERDRHG